MNQTKTTDLAQDLQALEVHLKRVVESPAYHNLVDSGFYSPDFTLVDALTAVQQAKENYDEMKSWSAAQQTKGAETLSPTGSSASTHE